MGYGSNLLLQIIVPCNTNHNFPSGYLLFFQLVSLASLVKCNLIHIILIKNKPTNMLCSSESAIFPFLHMCSKTCAFLSHQILPLLLCHICSTESSSRAFLPRFSTSHSHNTYSAEYLACNQIPQLWKPDKSLS